MDDVRPKDEPSICAADVASSASSGFVDRKRGESLPCASACDVRLQRSPRHKTDASAVLSDEDHRHELDIDDSVAPNVRLAKSQPLFARPRRPTPLRKCLSVPATGDLSIPTLNLERTQSGREEYIPYSVYGAGDCRYSQAAVSTASSLPSMPPVAYSDDVHPHFSAASVATPDSDELKVKRQNARHDLACVRETSGNTEGDDSLVVPCTVITRCVVLPARRRRESSVPPAAEVMPHNRVDSRCLSVPPNCRRPPDQPTADSDCQCAPMPLVERSGLRHPGVISCQIVIALLGATNVGKTALWHRVQRKEIEERHFVTVGNNFTVCDVQYRRNKVLSLRVGDTAGHSRFAAKNNSLMTHDAIVITYSISDHATFLRAAEILDECRMNAREDVVFFVCGNKSDLATRRRAVPREAGSVLAQSVCGFFAEVSAKTNANVTEMFIDIIREVLKVSQRQEVQDVRRCPSEVDQVDEFQPQHYQESKSGSPLVRLTRLFHRKPERKIRA